MSGYRFAKKVEVDGIVFDSQMEADYYLLLKERQGKGEISSLECHPSYLLQPAFERLDGKKEKAITYEPDFRFLENGKWRCVDVKGFADDAFRLKRKLYDYLSRNDANYPPLSVLKYSKTTGWVDEEGYKSAMRSEKARLRAEKNAYKKKAEMQSELLSLMTIANPTKSQKRRIEFLRSKLR